MRRRTEWLNLAVPQHARLYNGGNTSASPVRLLQRLSELIYERLPSSNQVPDEC